MSSRQNQIRVFGQRSIVSSFNFRSSNLVKDSNNDGRKKDLNKESSISLTDFLDRKLQRNVLQPKTVQRKLRPFCSPMGPTNDGLTINHQTLDKKEEEENNPSLDQLAFEQFKHTGAEKGRGEGSCDNAEIGTSSPSLGMASYHAGKVGSSHMDDVQGKRKRGFPFEGYEEKHTTLKHPLVLGTDPQPKRLGRKERSTANKRPRCPYNHYANGSGWWDCDMEGVDSEEVGFSEVWEGLGSTTFGGIVDWH